MHMADLETYLLLVSGYGIGGGGGVTDSTGVFWFCPQEALLLEQHVLLHPFPAGKCGGTLLWQAVRSAIRVIASSFLCKPLLRLFRGRRVFVKVEGYILERGTILPEGALAIQVCNGG